MNKIIKMIGVAAMASAAALSMTACSKSHTTHVWGKWQHNEEEHWRVCTVEGCNAEERESHDGYPCEVCAFKAVAFYTGINDQAHVSFVNEANNWFAAGAETYNYFYESTNDWSKLNDEFLADCDIVLFLDTRPEDASQRAAFERYMQAGGAWMGFHFCAFALDGTEYAPDWDWYHNEFLGSGQYTDNTWAPTAETLKIDSHDHPATENLPDTIESAPCEWYSWELDLRENPDIEVLASIDESSFPVGNNPGEIWYEGDYPVVWTNKNYKMIYFNMGHNIVTYGNNSQDLSSSFSSEMQNQLIIDAMLGLAR